MNPSFFVLKIGRASLEGLRAFGRSHHRAHLVQVLPLLCLLADEARAARSSRVTQIRPELSADKEYPELVDRVA